mmetsp:Transcript_1383/g.4480  ORF Transcript_1383/g.4480 Transcript_1383/m.4480 type:complete len:510 (-) Transcript_1383:54-1583(-)
MGAIEHGATRFGLLSQEVQQRPAAQHVEVRGDLVDEQHPHRAEQLQRNLRPAHHAIGEQAQRLCGIDPEHLGQADHPARQVRHVVPSCYQGLEGSAGKIFEAHGTSCRHLRDLLLPLRAEDCDLRVQLGVIVEGALPQDVHDRWLGDEPAAGQHGQERRLSAAIQPHEDAAAAPRECQLVQPQGNWGPGGIREGKVLHLHGRAIRDGSRPSVRRRGSCRRRRRRRRRAGARRGDPIRSHGEEATVRTPGPVSSLRWDCFAAHEAPLVHLKHVRRPCLQAVKDMGDVHNGAPVSPQEAEELLADEEVQVGGSLVQQQHGATVPQLPRELEPPPLSVREAAAVAKEQPAQPKEVKELLHAAISAGARLSSGRRLARPRVSKTECLPHAHERAAPLAERLPGSAQDALNERDLLPGGPAERVPVQHLDAAGGRHLLPSDQLQERGLPRAVRPDQDAPRARGEPQGDVPQQLGAAREHREGQPVHPHCRRVVCRHGESSQAARRPAVHCEGEP